MILVPQADASPPEASSTTAHPDSPQSSRSSSSTSEESLAGSEESVPPSCHEESSTPDVDDFPRLPRSPFAPVANAGAPRGWRNEDAEEAPPPPARLEESPLYRMCVAGGWRPRLGACDGAADAAIEGRLADFRTFGATLSVDGR